MENTDFLGHRQFKVTRRSNFRLGLRIRHLCAADLVSLLVGNVRISNFGGNHKVTVAVRSQPAVERIRSGENGVGSAGDRYCGHIQFPSGGIGLRAVDLDNILILVLPENIEERSGPFFAI